MSGYSKHGVYALYVPSARRPVGGMEMERFPSREICGRMLQQRVRTGTSRTWYVRQAHLRDRPEQTWPMADETGYLRVWLRGRDEPEPGLLSRPDEEWLVRETGGIEKIEWVDGPDCLWLSEDGGMAMNLPGKERTA